MSQAHDEDGLGTNDVGCLQPDRIDTRVLVTDNDEVPSLIDDDFEVIGSMNSHSIYTNTVSVANDTINKEESRFANGGDGEITPPAHNSLQSEDRVHGPSLISPSLERESHPISLIVSIREDYQAAQKIMQEEIALLKSAFEKKKLEVTQLQRELHEKTVENAGIVTQLEEARRTLQKQSMNLDEVVAGKLERDDIIKLQERIIEQLCSNGDMSCLPPSVAHEQTMISSLRDKQKLIDELRSEMLKLTDLYDREHEKVLDLEEIVKVLHSQCLENEQILQQTQIESEIRIEQLRRQIAQYQGQAENINNTSASVGSDSVGTVTLQITRDQST